MTDSKQPRRTHRTAKQLRALYEAAPSPQMAAALWEIHRLQQVILGAWQRFDRISGQPEAGEHVSRMAAQVIGEEPCIVAHLDAEWLRREEPNTRYHSVRHLTERPYYRPDYAPDPHRRINERGGKTAASRESRAYMERSEREG